MIVEYRENKRTLRGKNSKKKYRYNRRVLLKCEECGKEREVNCTRKIQQSETHRCKSCEEISMTLVKSGVIQFDHEQGKYHLPHLKEILDAYSVNSGETYILEIDKLGNMAILSQADKVSEGATTIPLGSRA